MPFEANDSSTEQKMYRHILLPIGNPERDVKALQHVAGLAPLCEAKVTLLRVAHYHTRDARAHEVLESEDYLRETAEHLRGAGVEVKTELRHGEPWEEIVRYANTSDVDLIVMSSHGHSELRHFLYGSIAGAVLRETSIPLLLIKQE